MPTERKVQQVADLVDRINRAEVAIAASFSSESVSNQTALRQAMSNSSIEVKVIKNTLLRRAAAPVSLSFFHARPHWLGARMRSQSIRAHPTQLRWC